MNSLEINKNFFELEKNIFLLKPKYKNIFYWELIRFEIHREILIKKNLIKIPNKRIENKFYYIIKNIIKIIKYFFISNPLYSKKKDIFIFWHPRRKIIDNINTDIYTDYIKKNLKNNYQDFEPFIENRNSINNIYSKNILFLDSIQYLKELFIIPIKLSNKDSILINEINEKIQKIFQIKINLKKIIIKNLRWFIFYKYFFSFLFKIKKPKIILEVVGYQLINKAINSAAKKLNIPTIEIQHGVINKYHLGYSIWYEKNIILDYFPDYIFTWWKYWNNICNYPKNVKTITTWFPYYEVNFKKYNIKKQKKHNIVIISQWAIWEELWKKIYKVAKKLKNYNFYYKLHPWEFHKKEKEFSFLWNLENVKLISKEKNIYDLFEICSIQIWVFSTAIYEWLWFWLNTIIFNLAWVEYLNDLVKKNIVIKVDKPKECIKIIENQDFWESNKFNNKYFFKKNAVNNIITNIKKIQN